MTNYAISLIRTYVPIGVGFFASWLAARTGIVIDESSQAGLILGFGGLLTAIYYGIIRWLEPRFPPLGWLLGLAKAPGYAAGDPPAPSPGPLPDTGHVV